LILLDFIIDGREAGWHFLQELKHDATTSDLPVLVVSAADAVLRRVAAHLTAWDCAVVGQVAD
jgi:hypothetical protein